MKNFFFTFIRGAKIHPCNSVYWILLVLFSAFGSRNESLSQPAGAIVGLCVGIVLLLPMYLYTSYKVGEANQPDKESVEGPDIDSRYAERSIYGYYRSSMGKTISRK
jgi:hypothetical protein